MFFCLHFIRFAYASLVTLVAPSLPHGSYNLFSFPLSTMTTNRTHHITTERATFFFHVHVDVKNWIFQFFFLFTSSCLHDNLLVTVDGLSLCWAFARLKTPSPVLSFDVDVLTWNEKFAFWKLFVVPCEKLSKAQVPGNSARSCAHLFNYRWLDALIRSQMGETCWATCSPPRQNTNLIESNWILSRGKLSRLSELQFFFPWCFGKQPDFRWVGKNKGEQK